MWYRRSLLLWWWLFLWWLLLWWLFLLLFLLLMLLHHLVDPLQLLLLREGIPLSLGVRIHVLHGVLRD